MKLVDIEEHYLAAEVRNAWDARRVEAPRFFSPTT